VLTRFLFGPELRGKGRLLPLQLAKTLVGIVHADRANSPPDGGGSSQALRRPASFALRTKAFLDGLRDLGYIDRQTITIEWKWGQDRVEGLPELAADLVGRDVDVLVTGGTPAAKALKSATGAIPIVMAIIGDPVAAGLVESLARPGGNASGFSIVAPDLSGKRLELLKEIVPEVSPVAVMLNTKNPQSQFELKEMQTAAQAMGGRRRLFYEVRRTAREQTRIYIGVLTHPEITPQRPTAWLRMQSAAN
jgi:ABC transporter substrate binding protein